MNSIYKCLKSLSKAGIVLYTVCHVTNFFLITYRTTYDPIPMALQVTIEIVTISSYACAVSPAIKPASRKHSTPRPSSLPAICNKIN